MTTAREDIRSSPFHPTQQRKDATYVEKSVQIIDTKEEEPRTKTIHWVKVLWENHRSEEATWELRDQVQKKYQNLLHEFSCCFPFEGPNALGGGGCKTPPRENPISTN